MAFKKNRISEIEREEMIMKMQEKITAPLQWSCLESSCKIIDLKEQHYQQVLHLIKHHFFSDDPMCLSAKLLDDPISTQEYLDEICSWMRENNSIVAISKKSDRVVGAAILKINSEEEKNHVFSRMTFQILQGDVLAKLMNLKNALIKKSNIYQQLNVSKILRLYIICVHPSYKLQDVYTDLLEACIEMAIVNDIPAIVGIFTSNDTQKLSRTIGFNILSEINYGHWKINHEIVFNNPGIGNYSVALMGMSTPTTEYIDNIRKIKKLKIHEENKKRQKYQRQKDD